MDSTTDTTTDTTPPAEALRAQMIAKVQQRGYGVRPEVERVLLATPRHEFVPDATLEAAYNPWQAVITHRFEDGRSSSCISAPFVVALMLDQLNVQPGNRVLEIGAGTGYNATMLAQLTGRDDLVTTIDIDPDVTSQATRNLAAAGHGDVLVVTGDGALGYAENALYDRLIATVSPWDIPEAWWSQLAPGARLVAPLRWRGQARTVAFTYTADGRFVSDSLYLCGFVYLVGPDEGELNGPIGADGMIKVHYDRDQDVDLDALYGVFDQPRTTAWSGVTIAGDESHDGVWLRLTATDTRVCRIDVAEPVQAFRSPALVEGGSLAYLTSRRREIGQEVRWELGAIGHGPAAAELTEHLCQEIRAWAPDRDARKPTVVVYPAETPDAGLPAGTVMDKNQSRFVLTYDSVPG
jgi:protein-L-isoaspartate(D-aspartate) O-methyltransferase